MESTPQNWDAQDLDELRRAHALLEHPSFAAKLSNLLGMPLEHAMGMLPEKWKHAIHASVESSLRRAMEVAVRSLPAESGKEPRNRLHKLLAGGSGAVGGFFGPAGLAAELPVTTTLMLRSIADVARCEGENLDSLEARLACVEVFALGGRSSEDDAAEAGYYGLRIALSMHLSNVLKSGGTSLGVPFANAFLRSVAARYGVVVSHKAAAQLVPVAGAVTGATLNLLFLDHFQDMAQGHFTVRRLERKYGRSQVREAYERLSREETPGARTAP